MKNIELEKLPFDPDLVPGNQSVRTGIGEAMKRLVTNNYTQAEVIDVRLRFYNSLILAMTRTSENQFIVLMDALLDRFYKYRAGALGEASFTATLHSLPHLTAEQLKEYSFLIMILCRTAAQTTRQREINSISWNVVLDQMKGGVYSEKLVGRLKNYYGLN